MAQNPALNEAFPSPGPEWEAPLNPELYLVQDEAEAAALTGGQVIPEEYRQLVVEQAVEAIEQGNDNVVTAVEDEAGSEILEELPDDEVETDQAIPDDQRQRVVEQAIRALRHGDRGDAAELKDRAATKSRKPKKFKNNDDFYKGGSGGYWRRLKQWAKENHENDCLCYICGDPYVVVGW